MSQSQSLPEKESQSPEICTLKDKFGRSLPCYIEHYFEAEAKKYVVLLPVDLPVELFAWRESGDEEELVTIDNEAPEIDEIFPLAKAVLEEQNLTLNRTALTLTASGELPDIAEDEPPEEYQQLGELREEDDYEELQWLATFYKEEQEYSIYAPLDPLFIVARQNKEGEAELLSAEEESALEPMLPSLEEIIENQIFDEI
ncbi:MAG: DUF3727 domain-containing protein [Oscillatoria sp. SIO1A7]|nr:DUF3727 domain-containing protein [Oscillatoria sp. SIO1A7]